MFKTSALLGLTALLLSITASRSDDKVTGRGFGDDYDWFSFEAGLKESQATGKPVLHDFFQVA